MFCYKLRKLLILLAVGPPLLAIFIAMAVVLCIRWVISTHSDSLTIRFFVLPFHLRHRCWQDR